MKRKIEQRHISIINFIFNKLFTYLQPIEISKKGDWISDEGHKDKKRRWTIYYAECNFANIPNIPLIYLDVTLEIDEHVIIIKGNDFCYQFTPEQILTIWKRLKKAIN